MKTPLSISRRSALGLLAGALHAAQPGEDILRQAADETAGSWTMIVLTSPLQVAVPPPAPVSDPAYQTELAALKAAQATITDAQRENIDFWSRGGVARWMDLQLELVAKANLPPAPREDDTYPFPDAANPFADPRFPFANPPYAVRAYSYVAVAQFEALKVASYYQYLYNRPAPSRADSGVQAILPAPNAPAYPSNAAVIAGVTSAMLQLLFPADVERITLLAAAEREAALLSGTAVASDIAAGTALGQAVANLVIARARTDGMGAAAGNAAIWQSYTDQTTATGEIAWRSLESPPRPPMLPLFSRVQPWLMTQNDIRAERPGPPPSTKSDQMARELAEVKKVSKSLTRAQMAIAYKWADGLSTPTPPGHWNYIASYYIAGANFGEVRTARAYALLNMAMHNAGVGCWDTKFAYFNPRPSQLDRGIRTILGVPNFPSYTSGHSTFSAAAAAVLSYLFPHGAARFEADKEEAAISRLYGAIHYRADIEVGKDHGKRLAAYVLQFAQQDGADL